MKGWCFDNAVVNTGVTHNLMSRAAMEKMELGGLIIPEENIIHGYDGTPIHSWAKIPRLYCGIEELTFRITFHIFETIPAGRFSIILGGSFCKTSVMEISYSKGYCELQDLTKRRQIKWDHDIWKHDTDPDVSDKNNPSEPNDVMRGGYELLEEQDDNLGDEQNNKTGDSGNPVPISSDDSDDDDAPPEPPRKKYNLRSNAKKNK